jgi:hypothetical protein
MYPHERSLVKRLEGKPFALIGVNSDADREELKKVLVKESITWRSFWNGGSPVGPIAQQWQVHSWPTLCVLDAKGIIRHKYLGVPAPEQLNKDIDALLADLAKTDVK